MSEESMNIENTTIKNSNSRGSKTTLVAGLIVGLTASACCAGPLILLMLGISGSWIGNLSILEPFRPIFIVLAVGLLFLAYRKIFVQPQSCSIDTACSTSNGQKTQKILFWATTLIIFLSIAFPWYGTWLFDV